MSRRISILFLTPSPIQSASERYRIYQYLPHLRRCGFDCTVRPFASEALHRAIQKQAVVGRICGVLSCALQRVRDLSALDEFDLVVIHREAFPFLHPFFEMKAIQRHARAIFDFDDAIHVGHRDTPSMKYSWMYKLKYGPGINIALQKCHHVIAGNRTLAEHAARLNANVTIIPTVVDLQRYTYQPPRETVNAVTVGWVGSTSTSPYLAEIEPALRRLSEVHKGNVRFRTFGDPKRKLALPDFEARPFQLDSEIEDLRTIDIGIMPMPDNEWTRGKCAFKAIQYMALGIPAVASPVGFAAELIHHGKNGLLASSEAEWFSCLDRVVRDGELRRRLSANGRITVERKYSLQVWAPRVADLLERIATGERVVEFAIV